MSEPDQSPMDALLQEQREGGVYVDSASFTLDSLRARQKLAQYQLPEAGLWLVKLVQAAVAAGAPEIRIAFGRSQVKVNFACEVEAESLLELVLSGSIPRQRVLWHLVTGIRASAGPATSQVAWSVGGQRVVVDSQGFHKAPDTSGSSGFELVASHPQRTRSLSKLLATSVSHLVRQVADEYEAVSSRCFVCPIPIFLDGRPLERGYSSPLQRPQVSTPGQVVMQYEKSRQNVPTLCLGLRALPAQDGVPRLPDFDGGGEEMLLRQPVYRNQVFARWPALPEIGGMLNVQCYYGCRSQVDWILDGAVVCSSDLKWDLLQPTFLGLRLRDHYCCARFFFPVAPEDLDLSQFELRDKAALAEQRLQTHREVCLETLQVLIQQIDHFFYFPGSPTIGKAVGVGMGGYLALASMAVGVWVLAPGAAVLGLGVSAHVLFYRRRIHQALLALLERASL